jgi:predicted nuclease with TOPRIM domain
MAEAFASLTKRYEQVANENYRLQKENKNFSEVIDNNSGEFSYLKTINERTILENMNSKETIQKLKCQNSELERKIINQSRYLELIDRSIIVARAAISLSEQENID